VARSGPHGVSDSEAKELAVNFKAYSPEELLELVNKRRAELEAAGENLAFLAPCTFYKGSSPGWL